MYGEGQGVVQDHAVATMWYLKAAEQGHASGQNNLSNMYNSGLGVPQNYSEAAKWFRYAADQGAPTLNSTSVSY